jgi:hypothetical protein
MVLDSGKVVNSHWLGWAANDFTLGIIGQFQGGRPYPVSTGTAGFSNALFFGAGNETQQRPSVLANGSLTTRNIPSSSGSNLAISQAGVSACTAAFPTMAAQCQATQTTFLAPAGASTKGALDSITGDVVDFQFLNGNLERDAGLSPGFYQLDLSLTKAFRVIPSHENIRVELRADAFNIFNHGNLQGNNGNDVLAFSLPAPVAGDPASFFNCTSCINPTTGLYVGNGGRILNVSDFRLGKVSPNLGSPVLAGMGDPASAAIPRTLQLAIRVRF